MALVNKMAFLAIVGVVSLVTISSVALAYTPEKGEVCTWRGTAPVCDGECWAGEVSKLINRWGDGAECVSGEKQLCCRSTVKIGKVHTGVTAAPPCDAAHYGTEGCPYPPFGGSKQKPAANAQDSSGGQSAFKSSGLKHSSKLKYPCGKGMSLGGDGQCYPDLH